MSQTISQNPWTARGWVGAAQVVAPFKAALEARFAKTNEAALWGPAYGNAPVEVDLQGALMGFAVALQGSPVIVVPDGVFEAAPWMAALMANTMAARGADVRAAVPAVTARP